MIWPTDILSYESWILIFFATFLVKYYINQRWQFWKKRNIPYDPPSVAKLGNVKSFFIDEPFTYPLICKRKYGPVYGYYYLLEARLCVHDVDILRRVFITEFSAFPYREDTGKQLAGGELAHGLLAVKGERWKRMRTTITPAFSSAKLKQMIGIINRTADNTLEVFKHKVAEKDGLFEAKDVFSRLSLDVICSAAFSTDVNSQDETKGEPAISRYAKMFSNYGIKATLRYLAVYFPILEPLYDLVFGVDHVKYFSELSQQIARQRNDSTRRSERVDLMQLMLDFKITESELKKGIRRGLSSVEVIGNAITMMIAGYETTGTAMTYLAYNLAMHPDIQLKLQAEVDEKGGILDFDSVNEMQYLDMCIKETLRLYCPLPWTVRTAEKTATLGGVTISKGSIVGIPIHSMCHDPDFWDEPMEFRPERMKNLSEMDSMVFIPFGAGPRNCIGSKFAMLEMKIAFSKILQNFTIESTKETPKPPLELAFGLTTCPKVELTLRVVPRSTR